MQRSTWWIIAVCGALVFQSCSKDDDDDNDNTPTNPTNPTNPQTQRPDSYVVIQGDSFFLVTSNQNPDPNAFRYQMNFASVSQLDQAGNDGNPESTLSIVWTQKEKPTATGVAPLSANRFQQTGSDSLNLYVTFFINTGHPLEGVNYLSPAGKTVSFTIANGKLVSTLPDLNLINEGDPAAARVDLSAGYWSVDW